MVTSHNADIKMPVDKLGKNFFVALIRLVLTGIYMNYLMFDEIIKPGNPLDDFPQRIGEWENTENHSLGTDVLDILKVDDYILRDYKNPDGVISSLYIGYYQSHRRSAEIHTPENCQAGGGWVVLSEKKKNIVIPGSKEKINFVEAVYEKDQEKKIFIYWYYLNGKYITNFFQYKFNVILDSVLYHRSDASFIRIVVPVYNDDISGATEAGEKFLKEFVPVITNYLS